MKVKTLNKPSKDNVVVYICFTNAWGEVNEKVEVARFKNANWADDFLASIRAEAKANEGKYTGYIYEVEEVQ